MTVRARLTFWYAAIMFVSLLLMGVLSYHQFSPEPRGSVRGKRAEAKEDENDEGDVREALTIIAWCGAPAALLALTGGWWLMRKALEPVAALTRAAEEITEHNLSGRLPRSHNGDELDRLTEVFNAMTERLDNSFQRVREFTLHASHELKTPLTILHGQFETALRDEDCNALQLELMLSQLDEVQRLTRIVDGLTLLTRADAGQVVLSKGPVRLDILLREAYADALILAQPQQTQLALNRLDEVIVTGDRDRLRQLLLNLSDNAIKYNHWEGQVAFDLRAEEKYAVLTVTNTGAGIPPELLSRVFDRFFRGDTAHSGVAEGCGLGLSIAQWIVTAHGGDIRIASIPNEETTVTVHLPLRPDRT